MYVRTVFALYKFMDQLLSAYSSICNCFLSKGDLTAIVELPLGRYEYKFVVDGHWVHDPNEVKCCFLA